MFKLVKDLKVRWPVTIEVPQDDGKTKKYETVVDFRVLPDSERDGKNQKEILKAAIAGWPDGAWKGVDDQNLDCTPEVVDALLDFSYVWLALWNAYQLCLAGAKAKN